MCFKYEKDLYGYCWDGTFIWNKSDWVVDMLKQLDIKVKDDDRFEGEFFKLFEKMFDEGIVVKGEAQ
jgi:hypothetical protein